MKRFKLRDLFGWTTLLAGLLGLCVYFGFDNTAWWLCFVYIGISTSAFAFSRPGRIGVLWVILAGLAFLGLFPIVLGVFIGLRPMVFTAWYIAILVVLSIGNLLYYSILIETKRMPEQGTPNEWLAFRYQIVGAMSLAMVAWWFTPNPALHSLRLHRAENPIVTLPDPIPDRRIGSNASQVNEVSNNNQLPNTEDLFAIQRKSDREFMDLVKDPQSGLGYDDVTRQYLSWKQRRVAALREYHDREYESFIIRFGEGISRGSRDLPRQKTLDLPFRKIDLEAEGELRGQKEKWQSVMADSVNLDLDTIEALHKQAQVSPDNFHRISFLEFVNPVGWGWGEQFRRVAGFSSHGFRHPPLQTEYNSENLIVKSIQLVSLERFDEPRVYEVDNVPQMVELSSATVPTRALTTFESEALQKLLASRANSPLHVVIDEQPDHILMLGAIPSTNACMQCHSRNENGLIGAFSYYFSKME